MNRFSVDLLNTPDESLVIRAASASPGNTETDKSNFGFMLMLMNRGHLSPFEHLVFTFEVECSKYTAVQIMRHRIGSFVEQSRRYVTDHKVPYQFQMPDKIPENMIPVVEQHYKNSVYLYQQLIDEGAPAEEARGERRDINVLYDQTHSSKEQRAVSRFDAARPGSSSPKIRDEERVRDGREERDPV